MKLELCKIDPTGLEFDESEITLPIKKGQWGRYLIKIGNHTYMLKEDGNITRVGRDPYEGLSFEEYQKEYKKQHEVTWEK